MPATAITNNDMWLLVIAHPDDESMFFIPTLRHILRRHANNNDTNINDGGPLLHVLCLSNGDYRHESDGPVRAMELRDACSVIGMTNTTTLAHENEHDESDNDRNSNSNTENTKNTKSDNATAPTMETITTETISTTPTTPTTTASTVTVLNDAQMKDGPNSVWHPDLIAQSVLNHVRNIMVPSISFLSRIENHNDVGDANNKNASIDNDSSCCWRYMEMDSRKDDAINTGINNSTTASTTATTDTTNAKVKTKTKIQAMNLNILTFDEGGVSGHPNHVDVFHGICHLMNEYCRTDIVGGGGDDDDGDGGDFGVGVECTRGSSSDIETTSTSSPISTSKQKSSILSTKSKSMEPCNLSTTVLRLCPCNSTATQQNQSQQTKNQPQTNNIILELNVHVYTLQTIANPLYKYFLWIIVDMLPLLAAWVIRDLFWNLIYFLLGGRLFTSSKSLKSSPLNSSPHTKTDNKVPNGTTIQWQSQQQQHYHHHQQRDSHQPQQQQHRIMEPRLVWNAMAAHHSQFVWYRRLSVLFSRYTYINDLRELTLDGLPSSVIVDDGDDGDHDNDDASHDDNALSLPPVVIVQEDDESSSPLHSNATKKCNKNNNKFLLSPSEMNALRQMVLPPTLHHRPWTRIYSLSRDGDSFIAFQKLVGGWNTGSSSISSSSSSGQQPQQSNTILVVKTTEGDVIGGYADVPFVKTVLSSSPYAGAGNSCLFRVNSRESCVEGKSDNCHPAAHEDEELTDGNDSTNVSSIITVYGKNNLFSGKRIVFDVTRRIIAFGGGGGGSKGGGNDDIEEGFGLCLEDGFSRGTTSRCEAFGNDPLVRGNGGVFGILDVEVWGFVFGQL